MVAKLAPPSRALCATLAEVGLAFVLPAGVPILRVVPDVFADFVQFNFVANDSVVVTTLADPQPGYSSYLIDSSGCCGLKLGNQRSQCPGLSL